MSYRSQCPCLYARRRIRMVHCRDAGCRRRNCKACHNLWKSRPQVKSAGVQSSWPGDRGRVKKWRSIPRRAKKCNGTWVAAPDCPARRTRLREVTPSVVIRLKAHYTENVNELAGSWMCSMATRIRREDQNMRFALVLTLSAAILAGSPARSEDWPCWRGPWGDGISRESGLLDKWPEHGPRQLWRAKLTGGFSSMAVADGRLFTMT